MLDRRTFLTAIVGLTARIAVAREDLAPLARYERDTNGRIGLYAKNLTTGKTLLWRADERFVMCSTFKASLAGMVLSRVDRGQDSLSAVIRFGSKDVPDWHAPVAKEHLAAGSMTVGEMCEAAVEHSDNTCANLLLARAGGPAALTAFWRSTADAVTRLDHNEPALNRSPPGDPRDTTTPAAMAGTLQRLVLGEVLSHESRERLKNWMVNCKTGANRLRAGLPVTWKVADKTGNNGEDAAADIAIVWTLAGSSVVVCAYTQGGKPKPERLTAVFTEIGRLVGERLG